MICARRHQKPSMQVVEGLGQTFIMNTVRHHAYRPQSRNSHVTVDGKCEIELGKREGWARELWAREFCQFTDYKWCTFIVSETAGNIYRRPVLISQQNCAAIFSNS